MQTAYELKDKKISITKRCEDVYEINFEDGKFLLWLNEKELKELRDRVSEALDPPEEDKDLEILREAEDIRREMEDDREI